MDVLYIIVAILLLIVSLLIIKGNFVNRITPTDTVANEPFTDHKSIDDILQQFSNSIFKPGSGIRNISESYIITENNLSLDKKRDIQLVIAEILGAINPVHQVKYSLLNIERVKVEKNLFKEHQYSIVFLIHEVDKFLTRKVILQYKTIRSGGVHLQNIRTLQGDDGSTEPIHPYDSDNNFLNSTELRISAKDPDEATKFKTPYSTPENFTVFQSTRQYKSLYEL